ncbi:hypothetical protein BZA70DRAFT_290549 [Myxozyma melibiosi]|uniref:Uncharacterized protein n=1 Tax=Myxozyma melibiosi TaxID=54550 RepID=A0ABR1F2C4_9ASCO
MSALKYPYLISKVADPIFGIFVGAAAFYLYERRDDREQEHTLYYLAQKRFAKVKKDDNAVDAGLTATQRERRIAEAAAFENSAK